MESLRRGGIAAMELIARDLKAQGLYVARALSFAGIEYDILEHRLSEEQVAIYDAYADAWGISLDVPDQSRRIHYLLEPGWRADAAIQGLGRTHRTHQSCPPLFRPVSTDCRGERRFISTIARRLDSLGALTRGQRQTGGQGLFDSRDNLESDFARESLDQWFRLLFQGKLQSVCFDQFQALTGLNLAGEGGGLAETLPTIQRWLNRILALRIAPSFNHPDRS